MWFYLINLSFLLSVFEVVSLVITLSSASRSEAQMVTSYGGVRTTFSVTPEVTWCSQRLLYNSGSHSGLFPWMLFTWACSSKSCCLRPVPTEVTGPCLVPWRWLVLACFHEGHWLGPAVVEVMGLSLLRWELLAGACSGGGQVTGSGPALAEVVPLQVIHATAEVAVLGLLWWELLAWACNHRCPCLGPAPMEVTSLGLLW